MPDYYRWMPGYQTDPVTRLELENIWRANYVRYTYEGENETYIEASAENSGSILYDKEIRDKPRTRRTKRNV